MNQHAAPPATVRAPPKDYALALIRVVSRRLKHIDEQVVSIGVALSNGLITAAKARELVDDIAPRLHRRCRPLDIERVSGMSDWKSRMLVTSTGSPRPLLANAITAFSRGASMVWCPCL